jgi:hypothetical protein
VTTWDAPVIVDDSIPPPPPSPPPSSSSLEKSPSSKSRLKHKSTRKDKEKEKPRVESKRRDVSSRKERERDDKRRGGKPSRLPPARLHHRDRKARSSKSSKPKSDPRLLLKEAEAADRRRSLQLAPGAVDYDAMAAEEFATVDPTVYVDEDEDENDDESGSDSSDSSSPTPSPRSVSGAASSSTSSQLVQIGSSGEMPTVVVAPAQELVTWSALQHALGLTSGAHPPPLPPDADSVETRRRSSSTTMPVRERCHDALAR